MRVLGIDPGFGRIGVAIIENGKLLASDCIETSKELSHSDRLNELVHAISMIIKEYQPEHLAIEKLFFNTNQKTVMQVAEARGAIISLCVGENLETYEYTPIEIKVAVTGYGRASKAQVSDMVKKLINIKKIPRFDDEYDAIAVALTHVASHR